MKDFIREIPLIDMTNNRKPPKRLGERHGKLVVVGWGKVRYTKSGYRLQYWRCKCDCGNIHDIRPCDFNSGRVVSCGCVSDNNKRKIKRDLTGQKFGKLTVIERSFAKKYKNNRTVFWLVKCECGVEKVVSSSNLTCERQISCGECGLFRNGMMTSHVALKLHDMIGEGIHNYYTGIIHNGHNINVDIGIPEFKLAIEYDGRYYHKDKIEWDREQSNKLVKNGWKVLRIDSDRDLPTEQELSILINYLKKAEPQTIVLHI